MPGVGGIHIGLGGGGGAPYYSELPVQTGLVAWYDAESSYVTRDGSNRVSAWADRSGTGDANQNLAQATAGKQPLWNASDANLGGRPSLTFAKSRTDYLASGTWTTPMPNPATWVMVGRLTVRDTNGSTVMDGAGAANRHDTQSDATKWLLYSGAVLNSSAFSVPSTFALVSIFSTSGKSYVTAKTAAATGTTGTHTLAALHVGAATGLGPGYYFDGQLAEIIGYNVALSQANVESILDWVGAKYGITIGS